MNGRPLRTLGALSLAAAITMAAVPSRAVEGSWSQAAPFPEERTEVSAEHPEEVAEDGQTFTLESGLFGAPTPRRAAGVRSATNRLPCPSRRSMMLARCCTSRGSAPALRMCQRAARRSCMAPS